MIQKWLWVFLTCVYGFISTLSVYVLIVEAHCWSKPDSHMIFQFLCSNSSCVQNVDFLLLFILSQWSCALALKMTSKNSTSQANRSWQQRCTAYHLAYHVFISTENLPIQTGCEAFVFAGYTDNRKPIKNTLFEMGVEDINPCWGAPESND